jgi:hypothetical protein
MDHYNEMLALWRNLLCTWIPSCSTEHNVNTQSDYKRSLHFKSVKKRKLCTGTAYIDMTELCMISQHEEDHCSIFFQKDGASPHIYHNTSQYLKNRLPGRQTARGRPIVWLPRALDQMPLDFLLWGGMFRVLYTPQYLKISMNSKFPFKMLVN